MFKIKDLLKIEEDLEILDFKVSKLDIPIWLYLRFKIFLYILQQKLNLELFNIKINPYKLPLNYKIRYIINTLKHHPFKSGNNKILIFGAAVTNVLENGKYYNRLYDPFIELFGNEVRLLELSHNFSYYYPRHIEKVFYSDIIPLTSHFLAKLTIYLRKFNSTFKSFEKILRSFINYIDRKSNKYFEISVKDYFANSLNLIFQRLYRYEIEIYIFHKLLDIVKPKLVIINDAHIGSYSHLIKLCKKLGIKVAEYQHGHIVNHLAYNWNYNIKNHIRDCLPDYMLVWGDYWGNNCNIPGVTKVIGYPYLEKKINKQLAEKKDIFILLISSGSIPDEYIKIAKVLSGRYKDKKLVFRPHPSEIPEINLRYKELLESGWQLDNDNLYNTLARSYICISLELSTVLFEAIVFCNNVFLIKTRASMPYIDNSLPIPVVSSTEQIFDFIDNDAIEVNFKKIRQKLFASNWEYNLKNFLNEIGIFKLV